MKTKICTSIVQSRKLLKLGLDPKTADMFWRDWRRETELITIPCAGCGNEKEDLPAWSLSALLSVLPTIDDEFEPQLHRSYDRYRCTYEGEEDSSGLWRVADNPVDACYEMILKLHELKML